MRSACVLLVILYHATSLSVVLHPELQPRALIWPYQVGASLLLVLSAYFACASLRRGSLVRYWWARVARLVPPFLAAVVLIFLVLRAFPVDGWWRPTGRDLLANLLMLWNWKPQVYPLIDGSHWTIPLQLMAFALAPVLYRTRWGHGRRLLAVLWAAVLIPLVQWPYRASDPPETYRMLVDGFGLHRWHLFVTGVTVWLWSTRRIRTGHLAALLAVCMAAQAVHTSDLRTADTALFWGQTTAVCLGMCLIALAAGRPDWDRLVPTVMHRPIRWFARVSYGMYLVHQSLGYLVIRRLQDTGWNTFAQTSAMVCTATLLGWLLTRVVERPARQWLVDVFDRWRTHYKPGETQPDRWPAPSAVKG